ncbi:MAG: hypothetical protein P8Y53_05070 [Pseudolabrys sp.]
MLAITNKRKRAGLERLGFRLAIYPGLARYAAGFAIREALRAKMAERANTRRGSKRSGMPAFPRVLGHTSSIVAP